MALGMVAGNCKANENAHTRVGECAKFEGTPLGIILADKNAEFSLDKDIFNEQMLEGIFLTGLRRIVPVLNGLTDMPVSGGDLRTNQEGFGSEVPNGENPTREDYIFNAGGFCLAKQLVKFDGTTVRVFKVDEARVAYGTAFKNSDGNLAFRGYLAKIGVTIRPNNGSQAGAVIVSIFYSPIYRDERLVNAQSLPLENELEGLTGIKLERVSAGVAKVIISCSGEDLTSDLGEDLGNPILYVNESGANPTTVAYANGNLTFTPATGSYKIVDAETLTGAGISGVEGENTFVKLSA